MKSKMTAPRYPWLNSKLDWSAIAEVFQAHGRVVISDFLSPRGLRGALVGLSELDLRRLWYQSAFGDARGPDFCFAFEQFPLRGVRLDSPLARFLSRSSMPRNSGVLQSPISELGAGNFLKTFSRDLDSRPWTEWMENWTGQALSPGRMTLFASRYRPGDFLAEHDDAQGARRLAWTLHLTPQWRAHWGGQLVILDDLGQEVIESIGPGLNQLTVFSVPLRHAVVATSPSAQRDRYAIAGWFNQTRR